MTVTWARNIPIGVETMRKGQLWCILCRQSWKLSHRIGVQDKTNDALSNWMASGCQMLMCRRLRKKIKAVCLIIFYYCVKFITNLAAPNIIYKLISQMLCIRSFEFLWVLSTLQLQSKRHLNSILLCGFSWGRIYFQAYSSIWQTPFPCGSEGLSFLPLAGSQLTSRISELLEVSYFLETACGC